MNRKNLYRIGMLALLAVAVAGLLVLKNRRQQPAPETAAPAAPTANAPAPATGLPRLLDLGSTKCQACQAMEAVLADLRRDYARRLAVDFIDVFVTQDAAEKYSIVVIPTQIFYDAAGKELFRHQGFISKDDIVAKFRELGVSL